MTANSNHKDDMPARLRSMLQRDKCLVAPGAFSPFVVPLIEEAGFPLVYATGLGAAASVAGYPDVGLLTQTEMVIHVRYIVQRASVPVIADADTGYGGATNAARTVHEYEDAGVAGLHVEDQAWPKRCGHIADKSVIPVEEMVEKIDAMVSARRNGDFVIFARSDAIAVEGFEAAVERGHRYVEAGADGLFFDALRTREQIVTVARTFPRPPHSQHVAERPYPQHHAGASGVLSATASCCLRARRSWRRTPACAAISARCARPATRKACARK